MCNLVWLENLNLRWDFKQRILDYIHDKHPELDWLYHDIYSKWDNTYWKELDKEISEYARKNWYNYLPADDKEISNHWELPRILNCFYHENLKKMK